MNAILLPSIKSVDFFIKNQSKYENYKICTDSPSVKIYLKYKMNIDCIDINDHFPSNIRNFWFSKLLSNYTQKLHKLDLSLNKIIEPNLRKFVKNWIFNLYRYEPFFYYFALFNFRNALSNFIFKRRIKRIHVILDFKSYHMFFSNSDVKRIIKSIKKARISFSEINIQKEKYQSSIQVIGKLKKTIKKIILLSKNLKFMLSLLFNKKENILIIEPLYELDITQYNKFNLYFQNVPKINHIKKRFKRKYNFSFKSLFSRIENQKIEQKIIFEKIEKHFENYFNDFLYKVIQFDNFIKKKKIKKCIWGLPPIHPNEKVLMIKHCQNNGIPVYGYQHGGCYNDMSQDTFHFLSDYHYCDKFFCYKNNKLKINKKILKNLKLAKHISVGSLKIKKNYSNKNFTKETKKRALFPITNWGDNFSHNMGMTSSEVSKRQEKILNLLKKLNIEVIIKFIRNTDVRYREISYPGYDLSKYLKNEKFIFEEKFNLQQSINFYKPDLIILETISTPLYESIINECDIICYNSKFNKLKKNVEKKLKKRVYVASSDQELLKFINNYKIRKLIKKRDKSFLKENLLRNF